MLTLLENVIFENDKPEIVLEITITYFKSRSNGINKKLISKNFPLIKTKGIKAKPNIVIIFITGKTKRFVNIE